MLSFICSFKNVIHVNEQSCNPTKRIEGGERQASPSTCSILLKEKTIDSTRLVFATHQPGWKEFLELGFDEGVHLALCFFLGFLYSLFEVSV